MRTFENIINGQLIGASRTFVSKNPATDETIGLVPHSDAEQARAAITAARAAQPGWAALRDIERKATLMEVAAVLRQNAEGLAEWVTREQGKPLGGVGHGQVPGSRFELFACELWTKVPAGPQAVLGRLSQHGADVCVREAPLRSGQLA